MRIAIFAPGPSLAEGGPTSLGFDARIFVNTAVAAPHILPRPGACGGDWWCAGDWETLGITRERFPEAQIPCRIFTMRSSVEQLLEALPQARIKCWDEIREHRPPPPGWCSWSGTAALVLAVHLGARIVETFGVDLAGATHFDGSIVASHEGRWREEGKIWNAVVAWARSLGVTVIRSQPADVQQEVPA